MIEFDSSYKLGPTVQKGKHLAAFTLRIHSIILLLGRGIPTRMNLEQRWERIPCPHVNGIIRDVCDTIYAMAKESFPADETRSLSTEKEGAVKKVQVPAV